jgi:endoglycosylceramidase
VVLLHGTNFVQKFPPIAPDAAGFGEDDVAYLAEQGFNALRLGAVFGAIIPEPGRIDQAYVDSVAETARLLARHGIYVQLDFHQDGYGPYTYGNGFPEWATLTDGLPNPPDPFPTYYITNHAMQRAFDNFWDNVPGPDGVPLQEHYAAAVRAVATAVADEPRVLGYDLMNEPWPGSVYEACLTGCPDIEQARLVPFGERMTAAIRAVDPEHFVFSEPWVLFNFGQTKTSLSGIGAPASGLSFHVYGTAPRFDEATVDNAIASDTGDALLITEFGATRDVATIARLTGVFDDRLVPWLFWTWDEDMIRDVKLPPTPDNVHGEVVAALARPYASATNGTPASFAYDPATRVLDYAWTTTRPDGSPAPVDLPTTIVLPEAAYGTGWAATVGGGRVVSAPCGRVLAVLQDASATHVEVRVTPDASCAG